MRRLWLLALFASSILAAETDGPYVMKSPAGQLEAWSVEVTGEEATRRVVPVAVGAKLTVPAVNALPAFEVKLRGPAQNAAGAVTTRTKAPLFIVADTHGEYEIFAGMLMKHRVVDERLRWKFGRGHLVVLGDVFDRGPHQVEILWLLYELEAQARKAGGGVHLVLGNHEVMVMRGDLRYMNPRYRRTTELLGVASYSELFRADSVLGQWLRSRPVVLEVNDLLCLHGGIAPEVIARNLDVAEINYGVRAVLNDDAPEAYSGRERAAFLLGDSGPLWYRGYFPDELGKTKTSAADVEKSLAHFAVSRILVGHTNVPTISPLFGGKVIAVQVYPRRDDAGKVTFEALLIRGGELLRARPDGSTEALLP